MGRGRGEREAHTASNEIEDGRGRRRARLTSLGGETNARAEEHLFLLIIVEIQPVLDGIQT